MRSDIVVPLEPHEKDAGMETSPDYRHHDFESSGRTLEGLHPIPIRFLQLLSSEERAELLSQCKALDENWSLNELDGERWRFGKTRDWLEKWSQFGFEDDIPPKDDPKSQSRYDLLSKFRDGALNQPTGDKPHDERISERDRILNMLAPPSDNLHALSKMNIKNASMQELLHTAESFKASGDAAEKKLDFLPPALDNVVSAKTTSENTRYVSDVAEESSNKVVFETTQDITAKDQQAPTDKADGHLLRNDTNTGLSEFQVAISDTVQGGEPLSVTLLIAKWEMMEKKTAKAIPERPASRGDNAVGLDTAPACNDDTTSLCSPAARMPGALSTESLEDLSGTEGGSLSSHGSWVMIPDHLCENNHPTTPDNDEQSNESVDFTTERPGLVSSESDPMVQLHENNTDQHMSIPKSQSASPTEGDTPKGSTVHLYGEMDPIPPEGDVLTQTASEHSILNISASNISVEHSPETIAPATSNLTDMRHPEADEINRVSGILEPSTPEFELSPTMEASNEYVSDGASQVFLAISGHSIQAASAPNSLALSSAIVTPADVPTSQNGPTSESGATSSDGPTSADDPTSASVQSTVKSIDGTKSETIIDKKREKEAYGWLPCGEGFPPAKRYKIHTAPIHRPSLLFRSIQGPGLSPFLENDQVIHGVDHHKFKGSDKKYLKALSHDATGILLSDGGHKRQAAVSLEDADSLLVEDLVPYSYENPALTPGTPISFLHETALTNLEESVPSLPADTVSIPAKSSVLSSAEELVRPPPRKLVSLPAEDPVPPLAEDTALHPNSSPLGKPVCEDVLQTSNIKDEHETHHGGSDKVEFEVPSPLVVLDVELKEPSQEPSKNITEFEELITRSFGTEPPDTLVFQPGPLATHADDASVTEDSLAAKEDPIIGDAIRIAREFAHSLFIEDDKDDKDFSLQHDIPSIIVTEAVDDDQVQAQDGGHTEIPGKNRLQVPSHDNAKAHTVYLTTRGGADDPVFNAIMAVDDYGMTAGDWAKFIHQVTQNQSGIQDSTIAPLFTQDPLRSRGIYPLKVTREFKKDPDRSELLGYLWLVWDHAICAFIGYIFLSVTLSIQVPRDFFLVIGGLLGCFAVVLWYLEGERTQPRGASQSTCMTDQIKFCHWKNVVLVLLSLAAMGVVIYSVLDDDNASNTEPTTIAIHMSNTANTTFNADMNNCPLMPDLDTVFGSKTTWDSDDPPLMTVVLYESASISDDLTNVSEFTVTPDSKEQSQADKRHGTTDAFESDDEYESATGTHFTTKKCSTSGSASASATASYGRLYSISLYISTYRFGHRISGPIMIGFGAALSWLRYCVLMRRAGLPY